MVTVVSFNKRVPPGAAGARGTLAELMAKSKAAADAKNAPMAMETPTIMQGLGKVAQVISGGIQQGRAERQEGEARAELAQLVASKGLEEMDPQTLAQIGMINPELEASLRSEAVQARRDAAARAEAALDRGVDVRGQDVTAGTASRGQDIVAKTAARGQDVDVRGQDVTANTAAAGQAVTERGNELSAGVTTRGQDVAAKTAAAGQAVTQQGNVLSADVTKRGQDMTSATAANTLQQTKEEFAAEQGAPQTGSGKALKDYLNGKYGPVGSPEAKASLEAEKLKATAVTGNTTINMPGQSSGLRTKFYEKVGGELFPSYLKEGANAGQLSGAMDVLAKISPNSQGPISGAIFAAYPWTRGFDSEAALFTSIVQKFAPAERVEGSGSTSDLEYKGLLSALPQLSNYPEANAMIIEAVKAQAAISMARADTIRKWQAGTLDDNAAFAALGEIDQRSILTPELKNLIDQNRPPPEMETGTGDPALDERMSRYPARG